MVMANALEAAPSDFAGGNFVNFAVANWFAIPRWTALVNGLIATVPSGSRGGEGDDGGDGGKNGFHGVVVVKSCVESEFVTPIARFIGMTPQPVPIAKIAQKIFPPCFNDSSIDTSHVQMSMPRSVTITLQPMSTLSATEILAQLNWRYATKAFDPTKKIPADIWDAIEDALVLTPSSFGLQPWKFLVINDPALREQLVPHAWGQRQVADASHFVVMCAIKTIDEAYLDRYIADTAAKRGIPVEALAGLRNVILATLNQMSDEAKLQWAQKQCYIALGNLMTAAAIAGLDTCPMEGFVPTKFDEILGLEAQGLQSVVCCPVGYRSADDKYAAMPKVRWNKSDVIIHL